MRNIPKAYGQRANLNHTRPRRHETVLAAIVLSLATSLSAPIAAQEASQFGPDDLKLYCDGQQRYLGIIREADEKFGISGTDEKLEWMRVRDEANYTQIAEDLEAPYTEWEPVARAEWWNQRCEALWRGWDMIEEADAKAATADDARKVEEALMLLYIKMTDKELFKNFDGRPYTSVNCRSDVIDGFRLTGCTLAGGGFFNGFLSDPLIFMVANKDGRPAFAPLEANKDHVEQSSYADTEGNPVLTGWYVGPYPLPFNWSEAVERLGD